MSTIDLIVNSLQKTSKEKSSALQDSYNAHSQWLQSELLLIRRLIQQDPRLGAVTLDTHTATSTAAPVAVIEAEASIALIAEPFSSSSSSSSSNNNNSWSKKRKSPETAFVSVPCVGGKKEEKFSPEQKRSSFCMDDLVQAAGLPSDLNKMKKEHLIMELEKRGNATLSMKNKKDTLIDALKDCLIAEKRSAATTTVSDCESSHSLSSSTLCDANTREVTNEAEAPAVTQLELFSEVQQVVPMESKATDIVVVEAVAGPSLYKEQEFQESQALQESEETEEVTQVFDVSPPASSSSPMKTPGRKGSLMQDFRSMVSNQSAFQENANGDSKIKIESEFKNRYRASQIRKSQILEMEDASPVQIVEKCDVKESTPEIISQEVDSVMTTQSSFTSMEESQEAYNDAPPSHDELSDSDKSEEVEETWMEVSSPRKDTETETKEAVEDTLFATSSSADSSYADSVDLTSTTDSIKSSDSQQSMSKKPSNLQGNQSSFLDKSSVKPTIPALEKAKQAKAADELKALLKKKDQESRSKTSSAVQSVAKILSPAWKSKPTNVAKPANDINQPKKGIFSSMFKKAVPPTAVTAPSAITASAAAAAPSAITASAAAAPPIVGLGIATSATSTSHIVESKPNPFDVSVVEGKKLDVSATPVLVSKPAIVTSLPTAQTQSASVPLLVNKPTVTSIIEKYNKAIESKEAVNKASTAFEVKAEKISAPASIQIKQSEPLQPTTSVTSSVTVSIPAPITSSVLKSNGEQTRVLQEINPAPTSSGAKVEAPIASQEREYPIEDRGSDDEDSGTDDEEAKKKKERVPAWAQGQKLREALERQFGLHGTAPMDPDNIFPEVQTCSLEEIFGRRQGVTRKYASRTSSAHWEPDQLTIVEKRKYRAHMGYDGVGKPTTAKIH